MRHLYLLLFISSCSLFLGGKEAPKTAKGSLYEITFQDPDWIITRNKKSDYVFQNKKDGRIMLSNSFCDEFQEQSLERLAEKTFRTITRFKESEASYISYHEREAYRTHGTGLVDGVKVTISLLNTRRNNCYFDFLGISPKGTDHSLADFERFLNSVTFK